LRPDEERHLNADAIHPTPDLVRDEPYVAGRASIEVCNWDFTIMQRVHARGAAIKVLDKPHLDLTTKFGQGFLAFLSALAEDERERIHKRASEGRKAARQAGRRFGRKPKLNVVQQARARELVGQGWGLRRIAAEMNVHHSTIARLK
jgi:DNA invertase Pin-like site-specific DNA recombinase